MLFEVAPIYIVHTSSTREDHESFKGSHRYVVVLPLFSRTPWMSPASPLKPLDVRLQPLGCALPDRSRALNQRGSERHNHSPDERKREVNHVISQHHGTTLQKQRLLLVAATV